ncbi:serine/threonine-protein kinase [Spongiactinospora sp. TRM90649]|uniref:serine/threonine-protein kinase n=1 Tax=Spongiactinospora sp. TRM90649 TaxID=3031114 RepID=UPI0023F6FE27|nr:serine/threonine-protein kinase [Spongiactinospora sp. TRM90649]MDF5751319.1 serine/threonine-protein kinase [Spongiactinospora sp. TRM90649]
MPQIEPLVAGDPGRLGSFRLSGRIGEGGQGVVYLGVADNGERAAIKLLHVRFSGDTVARSRFARELRAAQRVASFCTARVIEADLEGDVPYIASEYIDGRSLREVIDTDGPMRGSALERLAVGTATALTAIHHASIIHRDFKPDNVLLANDGPRVVDFGIARIIDSTGTITSRAIGTPAYMAPEQIAGDDIGPYTDVFAWGATIAFAATGVAVFDGSSIAVVLNRVLNHEVDTARLDEPLRGVVRAALAKSSRDRPTADQLLLRLLGRPESGGASPAVLTQGVQLAKPDAAEDPESTRLARLPGPTAVRTSGGFAPGPVMAGPQAPLPAPPQQQWPPPAQPGTAPLVDSTGPGRGGVVEPARRRFPVLPLTLLLVLLLIAGAAGLALLSGWRPTFLGGGASPTPTGENRAAVGVPTDDSVVEKALRNRKITIGLRNWLPGIALASGTGAGTEWKGFEVDLATEIAKALGVPTEGVTFQATERQQRPVLLAEGALDMVISTYSINSVDEVTFAGPYYLAHVDVLVKDGSSITGKAGLEGKRLCQPESSSSVGAVQSVVDRIELVPAATYTECINKLQSGLVDAVPGDDLLLAGFANRENLRYKIVGLKLTNERYAVALRKGDIRGCEAVRAAIADLYAKGTVKALMTKYFGNVEFTPELRTPTMEPCR